MASGNIAKGFKWLVNATGALLGYVSGDGSEVELWKKGTLAARPAVSVYNVGMSYFADDENGGTLYRNYNGVSWTQIAVGLSYGTGTELYIRDTYANIDLMTGSYVGQRAFCSDYGVRAGAQREWTGAAWVWAPKWQLLKNQHAAVSAGEVTTEEILFTCTLPKLGANDMLRFDYFFSYTEGADDKTLKVKLDASSGVSNLYVSNATTNGTVIIRNRNSVSAQAWYSSGKTQFGDATQALTTTAKNTGTAGIVLTATGTKETAGNVITLEFADLWIHGGGA